MKKTEFGPGKWNPSDFIQAYSFRFTETPDFHQGDDYVASDINPSHREGYDNISLLTRETFSTGAKAEIRCSFEGLGCPEIILVETPEPCEDGAVRYGACFEVVLYQGGINVWRHYRQNGICSWHKRLGMEFPVAKNQIHTLRVEVLENELVIFLNGQKTCLRTEDLPTRFHMGITVCEGIARIHSLQTAQD